MANPQLQKGYTRIASDVLNQLMKIDLNGTQFRLVLAIWRYTYGFKRKSHTLSVTDLAELTNTTRNHVHRELKNLINKNIVLVIDTDREGARILSFNENDNEWSNKSKGDKPISKPKKKPPLKKAKYEKDNAYYKMAIYFYKRVEKVAKDAGVQHLTQKANMQMWADDMRKLIELDGATKRQAKDIMDWVTQDDFWKTNILSASKLRKQFTQLAIKWNAQVNPSQPTKKRDSRDKEIELQQWIASGGDPSEFNWN